VHGYRDFPDLRAERGEARRGVADFGVDVRLGIGLLKSFGDDTDAHALHAATQ
jgi:hypothetical protein